MNSSSSNFDNNSHYIDFWIESNSNLDIPSEIQESKTRPVSAISSISAGLSLLKEKTNISNSGSEYGSMKRKKRANSENCPNKINILLYDRNSNDRGQQFVEFSGKLKSCKHDINANETATEKGKQLVFLPRGYQHHLMKKWMKARYIEQGYELKKNYQCPPSPCIYNKSFENLSFQQEINLISYRYMRYQKNSSNEICSTNNELKEVICRFCHGVNWVSCKNYFKHLFCAHGIMTEIKQNEFHWGIQNYSNLIQVEEHKLNGFCTIYTQILRVYDFSRNILPYFSVSLIPLPTKFYSNTVNGGFKRIHVLCPNCSTWVRLGWCEHDDIMKEDEIYINNIDTIRNLSSDYDIFSGTTSYIQTKDRTQIEGLYENYFSHYIGCDFSKFQNRCLYVQIDIQ